MSRNDLLALRVCFFALKKFTSFVFVASFLALLEKKKTFFVVVVIVCFVRLGSECLYSVLFEARSHTPVHAVSGSSNTIQAHARESPRVYFVSLLISRMCMDNLDSQ